MLDTASPLLVILSPVLAASLWGGSCVSVIVLFNCTCAITLPSVVGDTDVELSVAPTSAAVWHVFSDGCVWLHSELLFADMGSYHVCCGLLDLPHP